MLLHTRRPAAQFSQQTCNKKTGTFAFWMSRSPSSFIMCLAALPRNYASSPAAGQILMSSPRAPKARETSDLQRMPMTADATTLSHTLCSVGGQPEVANTDLHRCVSFPPLPCIWRHPTLYTTPCCTRFGMESVKCIVMSGKLVFQALNKNQAAVCQVSGALSG